MLTQERLKQVIKYNPETGSFERVECFQRPDVVGLCSLNRQGNGYHRVTIDGKRYYRHRLAWFYMTGEWPVDEIDHINGNRADNRWVNLRDVVPKTNQQNRRQAASSSKSRVLGVSWDSARGKWTARIQIGSVYKGLGRFDDKEDARAAYINAKRLLHEGCTI